MSTSYSLSKRFALIATAAAALLAGNRIAFSGPNAEIAEAGARDVAAAMTATQTNRQPAPTPTVAEVSHFMASMSFGRLSKYLRRRREPVWIGHPRPMNHAKYLRTRGA